MEKNFNALEDCKRHVEQFFGQKDKKFLEDEIMELSEEWQKQWNKTMNTLFSKAVGENENYVFQFYLKLKELIDQHSTYYFLVVAEYTSVKCHSIFK